MSHPIGYTKNKHPVYVDLFKSPAARQIAREPHLLTLAAELLGHTNLHNALIRLEQDMGRDVGYDFVVKTSEIDTIFYVQLTNDTVYTRFIKNGKPLVTRSVSIVLRWDQDNRSYTVDDIWIGQQRPPRPGSLDETSESKAYWKDHAFIFENQSLQSRTLTKSCPY